MASGSHVRRGMRRVLGSAARRHGALAACLPRLMLPIRAVGLRHTSSAADGALPTSTWAPIGGVSETRALGDVIAEARAKRSFCATRTCSLQTPVLEVVQKMHDEKGSAVLLAEDGLVKGIVTEDDYLERIAHSGVPPSDVLAEHVMQERVIATPCDQSVAESIRRMLTLGVRHMVVLNPAASEAARAAAAAPGEEATARLRVEDVDAICSLRDLIRMALVITQRSRKAMRAADSDVGASSDDPATAAAAAAAGAGAATGTEGEGVKEEEKPLMTASDLLRQLKAEGRDRMGIINISPSSRMTASEAANAMAEKQVTSIIVMDDDCRTRGLFTIRDFLYKAVLDEGEEEEEEEEEGDDDEAAAEGEAVEEGTEPVAVGGDQLVRDLMTPQPELLRAKPHWTVERMATSMIKRTVRHIPILSKDETTLGVVSLSDLARFLVGAETAFEDKARGNPDFLKVVGPHVALADDTVAAAAAAAAEAAAAAVTAEAEVDKPAQDK